MSDIEPGYYWVRWKKSRPTGKWHAVEITGKGAPTRVWQCGSEVPTKPDDWEFGPRLEPPEEEK